MNSFRHIGCALLLCVVSASVAQTATLRSDEVDFAAFLHEIQKSINESGYVGLVWWAPVQYWEISAERAGTPPEKAVERYKSLASYTMMIIAVGKMGIGNVNWFSEPEIRESVVLHDSRGDEYRPLDKVTGDAQGLASIVRPIFANLLGPTGQNCYIFFFPAANKMAEPIADPLAPGTFSITITKLLGEKEKTLEWKLPLTSLSPARYCPVGKERLEANWKYCPWHGVKLDENAGPSPGRQTK